MAKKIFTFIAGWMMLTPCIMALCCDNLKFVILALVYGIVLYNSPKFSPGIRKFWKNFYRANCELDKIISNQLSE